MKAILSELRAADQFSLIDFNHNVRCWRDNLVSATPSQVEDAKKYIQTIHPNGGMRFCLQGPHRSAISQEWVPRTAFRWSEYFYKESLIPKIGKACLKKSKNCSLLY